MKSGQTLVTGDICIWEVAPAVCSCHMESGAQPPGADSWHADNRGPLTLKRLHNQGPFKTVCPVGFQMKPYLSEEVQKPPQVMSRGSKSGNIE